MTAMPRTYYQKSRVVLTCSLIFQNASNILKQKERVYLIYVNIVCTLMFEIAYSSHVVFIIHHARRTLRILCELVFLTVTYDHIDV